MGPSAGFNPIRRALAACLLVVGVGFGCDPGATTTHRQGSDIESRGDTCRRDDDCSSYLRCFGGHCSVPPAVSGEAVGEPARVSILRSAGDDVREPVARFNVELAVEPAQRRRGLMHRRRMASGWGMLFVYPNEAMRSFWMKNTHIALDMVFADRTGRIVHILENVEPMTTSARSSEAPAKYVLELKAGAAADHGLSRGMYIGVSNVPEALEPRR